MIQSLSIVLPMYNELDNIETAVADSIRVGRLMSPELEIVIVDDASTDGCGGIADRLADEYPEVRVIHHAKNRKLGGALRTGFAAAKMQWILYVDSDLPIHMEDAMRALPLAENSDIVIGWRRSRAESRRREIMSKAYNLLIRSAFDLRVRDVNFAFKLFRRSLLQKILLTSEGSFIDAELLIEMKRIRARVAEIGMDYYPRVAGVSTLASNRVVLKILSELIRYRLETHGESPDNFSGERRRLWLERGDQQRDTVRLSSGNPP